MMYSIQWSLATLSLASLAFGQDCYWPNGARASALKACSVAPSNDAAACCFADHYCMANGLCMSATEGTWYRGGCTDEQFLKSGCPRLCHTRDIAGGGQLILAFYFRSRLWLKSRGPMLTYCRHQQYLTVMPAYSSAARTYSPVSAPTTVPSRILQLGRTRR